MFANKFGLMGLLTVTVVLALSLQLTAATPSQMNYQGLLTDTADIPLTGTYSLAFTIYDHPTASAPANIKWQETHPAVSVDNGLFNVVLGNGSPAVPLMDGVFDGTPRYLGIKIGVAAEISPRTPLVTSPYAYRISTIDGSRGGDVTDTIRIISPTSLPGIEMFSLLNWSAIRFYEPVSVIPPLERRLAQPLLVELSDTALLMFPNNQTKAPTDTTVKITSDGRVRTSGNIAVGEGSHTSGMSSAVFGAASDAPGNFAMVAGGQGNVAQGDFSFAAGRGAIALHNGSFVWADGSPAPFESVAPNSFNIRAANGLILSTNAGPTSDIAIGGFYRDNSIIAWGRVDGGTGSVGTNQFGLQSVQRDSAGVYTVTLHTLGTVPQSLAPMACVEVGGPPTSASTARLITINQLNPLSFRVYITNGSYMLTDGSFTFMVTGR